MKNEFFGMMFHIRDYLHLKHLDTTNYAAHVAFQDAYNNLLRLTDDLIEGTIGIEGYFDISIPTANGSPELIKFISGSYEYVKINRKEFEENWQLAILDEIEKTFAILLYKIKYLK